MSNTLRYLLLIAAVVTAVWILRKIRKFKVKMEDAIFWIIFAVLLAILGIFPQATFWLTQKLGVMSPANLIFLVVIFLLMEKVFTLSLLVSQLEDKVTTMSAELALRSHATGSAVLKEESVPQNAGSPQNADGSQNIVAPQNADATKNGQVPAELKAEA